MPRTLCWFSCGAPSAVACKLTLAETPDAEVIRIHLAGEHADNARFHADVEKWLGVTIRVISSKKYEDHFDVAEKTRYINGPSGARCTTELKRKVREAYQLDSDIHVFGFDAEERDRADSYRDRSKLSILVPLVDAGLTKGDCKAILERAGIVLPEMYRLGYHNNNCIGCWKGGMGYWNKIRVDFPEVFAKASDICDSVGRSPLKKDGKPLMLRDLPPDAGRFSLDQPPSCGPLCELAEDRILGDRL